MCSLKTNRQTSNDMDLKRIVRRFEESEGKRNLSVRRFVNQVIVSGGKTNKRSDGFNGNLDDLIHMTRNYCKKCFDAFPASFADGVVEPLIRLHQNKMGHFTIRPNNIMFKYVSKYDKKLVVRATKFGFVFRYNPAVGVKLMLNEQQ